MNLCWWRDGRKERRVDEVEGRKNGWLEGRVDGYKNVLMETLID